MSAPRFERAITYAVLAVFAVGAIYPVLSILFLALHTKNDLVTGFALADRSQPARASGRPGTRATSRPGFKSSFIVAATVTVVSAVLSLGTGYAFGTMRFRGDRWLFALFLLGIIFPYEATVIPLYYDFQDVGLLNTYWALILPQIGQSVAFGTFWMRAFFRSTPRVAGRGRPDRRRVQLRRAACACCSPRPGRRCSTLCALVFIYTWNEFLLALVLVSGAPDKQTAPLGLSFFAGAARAGRPDQGRGGRRCSSRCRS